MGSGIAQAAVLAGYPVVLYDLNDELLASAKDASCSLLARESNTARRIRWRRSGPEIC